MGNRHEKRARRRRRVGKRARSILLMPGCSPREAGPVDPAHAWMLARGSRSGLRTWAASLPASQLAEGLTLVANVDEKNSGTRIELAGLLATKLTRGDTAGARHVLKLVPPPTRSVIFAAERSVLLAAYGDDQDGQQGPVDDYVIDAVSYAKQRRNQDSAALLWRELRETGRAPTDEPPESIVELTLDVAARTRDIPVAVLAHTAQRLLASDRDNPERRSMAESLLTEALHPTYRPRSAHVPTWPGITRAVTVAYTAAAGHVERRDFIYGLEMFAIGRGDLPDIKAPLADVAGSLYPNLEVIEHAHRGRSPRELADELDHLLGSDFKGYRYVRAALIALARGYPADTVSLLRDPQTPNFISLFHRFADSTNNVLIEVLPAIAATDLSQAVELAKGLRGKGFSAASDDALHTVALAAAADDWNAGSQIAELMGSSYSAGRAWADLAAVASRIGDNSARHDAYSRVLAEAAAAGPTAGLMVTAMIGALTVDPAPMPDILARLLPMFFQRNAGDVRGWFHLADLACVIARCVGDQNIAARAENAEQIVASAWRL